MGKKLMMYEPMGNLDLDVPEFIEGKEVLYFVVDEDAPVPEHSDIEVLIYQQRGYEEVNSYADIEQLEETGRDIDISMDQYKHGFMDWYVSNGWEIEQIPMGEFISSL